MRVILVGETEIRVQAAGGVLEVEAATPELHFSPLHMLAAALAGCTLSVLQGWGMQTELSIDDLEIGLGWEYLEDPYRVGSYDLAVHWPSLPDIRREAALRVAEHCTVEHTLTVPPKIQTTIAD